VKSFDIVILGGGPAGLTAALYAVRSGRKTVVIESLMAGGALNLTPEVDNFPGFDLIEGHELAGKMRKQAEQAGAEFIFDTVKSVDFDKRTVVCDGETVLYKSLIIAMGAGPKKLGVPGEERFFGKGVHTCVLCDGVFYRGKDVVVVGGGNTAVEEAIQLSSIAKSVTIINSLDKFTAHAYLVDRLKGVNVFHGQNVVEILGKEKLTGVKTALQAFPCDGVFVAVGRVPNTELFRGKLELSQKGLIVVDGKMQTSVPNVFAAGDVIQKDVRQIITACADGAVAATFASESVKN